MKTKLLVSVAMLLSAAAIAADDLPFTLPIPDGWRTETIPFPLGFAPELAYEGLEELRFAPGMFTAGAEDLWSYAFVWWIAVDTVPGPETLAADLVTYFDGLAQAVVGDDGFDPGENGASAHLEPVPTPSSSSEAVAYAGTATTFDAFVSHDMITLNVHVRPIHCPEQDRLAIVFELSPQPRDHQIWRDLATIRDGFRCRK